LLPSSFIAAAYLLDGLANLMLDHTGRNILVPLVASPDLLVDSIEQGCPISLGQLVGTDHLAHDLAIQFELNTLRVNGQSANEFLHGRRRRIQFDAVHGFSP
jgi:hypothetical protein